MPPTTIDAHGRTLLPGFIDAHGHVMELGIDAMRLDVVGTQDYSEMQYSIPGGRHLTRRREFAIQVSAPGHFRIPPVDVTLGRRVYHTNPVDLDVSGSAQPQQLQSSDDAWLHATMSPETVYVGQQSTLTVEAGFSEDLRMRLTQPPTFDTPSPTGFWVQDVPGGVSSQLRAVNGRVVETQSLQRAYFPLSAGKYALAPARAIIDVREGFLFAPDTREIRSGSPRLVVLPLPEAGKPGDFRGAVGSYTIRATLQSDSVAVGEAAQISIEVSGVGNIKAMPQPVLPSIAGVDAYAPTEEADVQFDGPIVRGSKTFQWVLIPQTVGRIAVPPIRFSFFDPKTRSYRTVATSPLSITATPGGSAADTSGGAAALRAIETQPRRASLQWVRTRAFALAQLLPLLLLLAALLSMSMRRKKTNRALLNDEIARIRTSHVAYAQFLRDLETLVRSAAVLRCNDASLRTAPVRRVGERLREKGVAAPLADRVVAFIERIETERFAPSAQESAERESLLAEADRIVTLLGGGNEPGGSRAAVGLIALALVQAPASSDFSKGVELYRAGRFADAADSFERVAHAQPHDIAAWSDLGNAYYRAGDRGHAVWAWAHAAREAPRDGAVVANLQAVGAVEVLRTRPPLSLTPAEWFLIAAILWWVACGLLLTEMLSGRRRLYGWAFGLIAIAAIALITGVSAQHARFAVALDDETKLYGDPTIHSPVVRTVQAGAGLDVLEVRGDWLRVRTIAETEGWVESDSAGML